MDSKRASSRARRHRRAELISQAQELERLGLNSRARERYERALLAARPASSDPTVAAVIRWIGNTLRAEGDVDAAADCYEASLAVAQQHGHVGDMAHALNWQAIVEQERGQMQSAHELYTRARGLAVEAGDTRLAAMIGQNLGCVAAIRGQYRRSVRYYARSLEAYRELGDEQSTARLLNNLALVLLDQSEWTDAAATLDEAATLCDRIGDLSTRVMIEVNRTDLNVRRGDLDAALRTCQSAHNLATRIDHKIALGEIYKWYGILYRENGRADIAESHFNAAAEVAARCENLLLVAEIQREIAKLYLSQDRNAQALAALNRAHEIFTDLSARRMVQDIDHSLRELESIFIEVVRHWGDSIEAKDQYTRGHCQRVADYACRLAKEVGFDEQTLIWFRMGAFLHDVGKTALPAELLNKRAPLTAAERKSMEAHTVIGEALLTGVQFPWNVRPMVRGHHERWDGRGYPDGLQGERIPYAARILCLADVYDALTTNRPYRQAFTAQQALEVMREDEGAFDPALFAIFEQIFLAEGGLGSAAA